MIFNLNIIFPLHVTSVSLCLLGPMRIEYAVFQSNVETTSKTSSKNTDQVDYSKHHGYAGEREIPTRHTRAHLIKHIFKLVNFKLVINVYNSPQAHLTQKSEINFVCQQTNHTILLPIVRKLPDHLSGIH